MNLAFNSKVPMTKEQNFTFGSSVKLTNELNFAFNSKVTYTKESNYAFGSKVFMYAAAIEPIINPNAADYRSNITPTVIVELFLNNHGTITNLSPYIQSTKYQRSLGGKTNLECNLIEYGKGNAVEDSPFITDYNTDTGSGSFYDFITSVIPEITNPIFAGVCSAPLKYHAYDPERYLEVKYTVGYPGLGYQTYTSPYLLITQSKFDGTTLTLRLEDFAVLLEFNYMELNLESTSPRYPDINMDAGKPGNAHDVIRQTATSRGIKSVVCNFPNYPIKLLRRTQGRPIDWVDMLARIYQAKRSFIGGTMILTPTKLVNELPVKWNIVSSDTITEDGLNFEFDFANYRNKYRVVRTSPNGGIIGEQECIGYQCPGRTGNIQFDTEVNIANGIAEVTNGIVTDFVYKDKLGTPSSVNQSGPSGLYIASPTPVQSVEFTYVAQIGNVPLPVLNNGQTTNGLGGANQIDNVSAATYTYTPRYKVTFYGKKAIQGLDSEFRIIKQDTEGIECLGLHEEYGELDDSVIPNASIANDYANALLREGTRRLLVLNMNTPMVNPFMEPGEVFTVTDVETNQNNLPWLIEDITISTEGNEATASITGTRGRF